MQSGVHGLLADGNNCAVELVRTTLDDAQLGLDMTELGVRLLELGVRLLELGVRLLELGLKLRIPLSNCDLNRTNGTDERSRSSRAHGNRDLKTPNSSRACACE
jgi:hypothetical protein